MKYVYEEECKGGIRCYSFFDKILSYMNGISDLANTQAALAEEVNSTVDEMSKMMNDLVKIV